MNFGVGYSVPNIPGGGGSNLAVKAIVQTLTNGDNTVTHNLGSGFVVAGFQVQDPTDSEYSFVQCDGRRPNDNAIIVTLSGGSITNAIVRIFYYA